MKQQGGFTLIEITIVVAVMLILVSVVILVALNSASESRDAKRVQELHQIANVLQVYYVAKGKYPENTDTNDPNCDIHGAIWDAGNFALTNDDFIKPLFDERIIEVLPREWSDIEDAWGSDCLYRYAKIKDPCDGKCSGNYAILYATCETATCPVNERPTCCNGSTWDEGKGDNDSRDIVLFLKQKN